MFSRVRLAALVVGVSLLGASSSFAAVIGVSSRAALNPTDSVVWSDLGGDLTALPVPTNTTSTNGVGVTVDGPDALALFAGSTFNADFLASDVVLSTYNLDEAEGVFGAMRLTFATGQRGAGAQIQSNTAGNFIGAIRAYGTGGNVLFGYAAGGTNNQNGDGSALFLGLLSDANDIFAIEFDILTGNGFAINDVSLTRTPDVPEPVSLTLVLLGAGLAVSRRRRR
ncbi:PEP-CTERM sorting domain-containing protein [Luteitalea sp.]|uniref:PEP-CTERM sorting domain-containing protein n=1 Tax=Luteitalea sp. TaxID=2004800 RepID=UPI0025B7D745|nr:PEP-CTERM sorting domain-containing protein [Luteitalea sp.]